MEKRKLLKLVGRRGLLKLVERRRLLKMVEIRMRLKMVGRRRLLKLVEKRRLLKLVERRSLLKLVGKICRTESLLCRPCSTALKGGGTNNNERMKKYEGRHNFKATLMMLI